MADNDETPKTIVMPEPEKWGDAPLPYPGGYRAHQVQLAHIRLHLRTKFRHVR